MKFFKYFPIILPILISFNLAHADVLEYFKDGTSTGVNVDTGTPANSTPYPSMLFNTAGVQISPSTESTLLGVKTDLDAIILQLPATRGQKTMAASLAVVIASDQSSIPVSVTQTTSPWVTNISQWGGSATTLGQKAMSASVPVALASDQSVLPVSQSGTWNITNISGTISLPTGASTSANQTTGNTSLGNIDTSTAAVNTNLGAKADAAASTDTGTFSLIALFKRSLQDWTTYLGRFPAALGQTTKSGSLPVTLASDQGNLTVTQGANVNGSYAEITNLTTTAQSFTPPTNSVGFNICVPDTNTVNVRYKFGTSQTATISAGLQLQPGRCEIYLNTAPTISAITESGSAQTVQVQWILSI